MQKKLVNIAIPNSVNRLFTYSLPEELRINTFRGQRVVVPFGRRKVLGFVIGRTKTAPNAQVKKIIRLVDESPLFSDCYFKFIRWISEYYHAGIGDVLLSALPPGMRKLNHSKNSKTNPESGLVLLGYGLKEFSDIDSDYESLSQLFVEKSILTRQEILQAGITSYKFNKFKRLGYLEEQYGRPSLFDYIGQRDDLDELKPGKEQKAAITAVTDNLDSFKPFLLYGITGSGKSLVYCHITRKILDQGKAALILVPEIALAGTLLSYFKAYFDDDIALLHSGMTDRERTLVWQNVHNGKFKIVIGARSALFAEMPNLGIIIVDEEHDESYKQDDPSPRFQGRDAAVMRAKISQVPVLLGSASPSVESMYNADKKRYELLKLTKRPEMAKVPLVRLVDLKEEYSITGKAPFYTPTLISKLKDTISRGNQAILYLNRRGFSPRIKCGSCGHTPECPNCNISLTYHKIGARLTCHYCGFSDAQYNKCANCDDDKFVYIGSGTQKVEEHLEDILRGVDGAKVVRLDSDSASARKRSFEILSDFAAQKYNILLGTQMVSKGIDFPHVSLVGILMADLGKDMPDFRADEKLFSKLLQVSGRSGRGKIPGEVIIQTFNPNSDLIDDSARQDYDTFYKREIALREKLSYPPFSHLINIRFSTIKEKDCDTAPLTFKQKLEERLQKSNIKIHLLGPNSSPLYRLRGRYRKHIMIKTRQIMSVNRILAKWNYEEPNFSLPSKVRVTIDIDPYDMM